MKAILVCFSLIATLQAMTQSSAQLPASEVDRLITLGRANKMRGLIATCTAAKTSAIAGALSGGLIGAVVAASRKGDDKYAVTVMGPKGWIARQAWEKTRAGQTPTSADVVPEWREPSLYLVIDPVFPKPESTAEPPLPLPITAAMFRDVPITQTQRRVERPSLPGFQTTKGTWKSNAGATVEYEQTMIRFDPAKMSALEVDEVELLLTTDAGIRSCRVSARDVKKFAKEVPTKK